jgi:hypothetical protein
VIAREDLLRHLQMVYDHGLANLAFYRQIVASDLRARDGDSCQAEYMLLSELITMLLLEAAMLVAALSYSSILELPRGRRRRFVASGTASALAILLVGALAFRNPEFGTDTANYSAIFQEFCQQGELPNSDFSFLISIWTINAAMLGSCNVGLLPVTWLLLVVGIPLGSTGPWQLKLRVIVILLFSMIGIALATDALRQGLSVSVMLAALGCWHQKQRAAAAVLCGLSVAFHSSAALVLIALIASTLSWPLFIVVLASVTGVVTFAMQTSDSIASALPVIATLMVYAAIDSDELVVRVLTFTCVLSTLAAPLLAARSAAARREALSLPGYHTAIRLAVCCIPPLSLPYFGYRFIFGVYPLILWLVISATLAREDDSVVFGWALCGNAVILLFWSFGSNYVLTTPFVLTYS